MRKRPTTENANADEQASQEKARPTAARLRPADLSAVRSQAETDEGRPGLPRREVRLDGDIIRLMRILARAAMRPKVSP